MEFQWLISLHISPWIPNGWYRSSSQDLCATEDSESHHDHGRWIQCTWEKNRWHLVDWMGHKYPSMRSVTIFKPMFSIKMKGKPIGSFSCCPICLLHRDAVDSHIYDGWFPSWNHSFDFFAWQMVLRQYDNVCICIESSSAFHRSNAQHLVFNIDQPPRWLWHSQFAMV